MENKSKTKLLALILFIASEIMFFAGLLSAYWVIRSQIPNWPPPGQPRYPLEVTAFNSIILFSSLATLWMAEKKLSLKRNYLSWLIVTVAAGSCFLIIQGVEWFRLIQQGMGLIGNVYGGLFYVVVGVHALHVAAGLSVLIYLLLKSLKMKTAMESDSLQLGKVYWAFVVLLWPFIYVGLYVI
ncbi:MAG: heme-copper oxidase subunit III [Deltaproteobacteria bacterium]|nr:heme-copper oxidase subunit III [Deltaproteobacteria bacterium]